jgi:hypothetical protein
VARSGPRATRRRGKNTPLLFVLSDRLLDAVLVSSRLVGSGLMARSCAKLLEIARQCLQVLIG